MRIDTIYLYIFQLDYTKMHLIILRINLLQNESVIKNVY